MWKNYLKIKEAAEFLGISCLTLRNWDRRGKLTSYRHPINHYRLYRMADLEKFMERVDKNKPRKINVKFVEE
jgi:MerR family transcriptional regulator, copper efflux regulator